MYSLTALQKLFVGQPTSIENTVVHEMLNNQHKHPHGDGVLFVDKSSFDSMILYGLVESRLVLFLGTTNEKEVFYLLGMSKHDPKEKANSVLQVGLHHDPGHIICL